MANAIETRLLPRIPALAIKYGRDVVFTLYPSAVADEDASSVALGTATTHTLRCFPPRAGEVEYMEDARAIKMQGVIVPVPSGALTITALAFSLDLAQRFTHNGKTYRIVKIETIASGEEDALHLVSGVAVE